MSRKTPWTLVPITFCQPESGKSSSGAPQAAPGVVDQHVDAVEALARRRAASCLGALRVPTGRRGPRSRRSPGRGRIASVRLARGDHDLRSGADEAAGDHQPDPREPPVTTATLPSTEKRCVLKAATGYAGARSVPLPSAAGYDILHSPDGRRPRTHGHLDCACSSARRARARRASTTCSRTAARRAAPSTTTSRAGATSCCARRPTSPGSYIARRIGQPASALELLDSLIGDYREHARPQRVPGGLPGRRRRRRGRRAPTPTCTSARPRRSPSWQALLAERLTAEGVGGPRAEELAVMVIAAVEGALIMAAQHGETSARSTPSTASCATWCARSSTKGGAA